MARGLAPLLAAAEERLLHVGLDRALAEPDAQQRAEKRLAWDHGALRRAVDAQARAGLRRVVEVDDHALLRLADALHRRHQRVDLMLEPGEPRLGGVFRP